ncbi:MAG TPA: zf-HC2 domain-containing protein [Pyrinomonadaceae bacterium]|nr:zf-HC2 domain-containing protein [Pyrinomonadaceae bacterium]
MTNFKHLTQIELVAYHSDSLAKDERHEIGKHLLNCAECRKLLPMPSVERFWAAIMTDSEIQDAPQKEDTENFLSSLSSLIKLQSGLLWGGAALLIIFCFSFLLWSGSTDSSNEVVQTFDNELSSELTFPLPVQTTVKENPASSTNSKRVEVMPTPKNLKLDSPKPKISQNNLSQDFKKPTSKQPDETISATRGVSAKCSENREVEIELSLSKENLVFKWKKVPKAVKYHLYISDDEEILIDEYETADETTFVLKKPLDPLKTYKWKIIITLENGQTIPGPSNKFTVKDFQTKQSKPEKKISDNRCGEDR